MKMKLLAAALMICATTAMQAQSGAKAQAGHATADAQADAQAKAKAQTSMLTAELGLDTKQAAEVEHLLANAEKKAASLRTEGDKAKPSLEKLSASTYASLKGLLTEEQGKKLDALKAAGKWDIACAGPGTGKGCCAGAHGEAGTAKPACCQGKGGHAEKAPATVQ